MKGADEEFSMEKLKEIEERSKAKRYIFRVSELDSNIKLKNYLIDKVILNIKID